MTKRSVAGVILLTLVTFSIYQIYWYVKTKDEMVAQGAEIPTGWLLLVPFANIYWLWKWCTGVEHVTRGKTSAPVALLLMILLSVIGSAILQSQFNAIAEEQRIKLPEARIA
jgi:hypothetical protein